jgi:hypothetical protein
MKLQQAEHENIDVVDCARNSFGGGGDNLPLQDATQPTDDMFGDDTMFAEFDLEGACARAKNHSPPVKRNSSQMKCPTSSPGNGGTNCGNGYGGTAECKINTKVQAAGDTCASGGAGWRFKSKETMAKAEKDKLINKWELKFYEDQRGGIDFTEKQKDLLRKIHEQLSQRWKNSALNAGKRVFCLHPNSRTDGSCGKCGTDCYKAGGQKFKALVSWSIKNNPSLSKKKVVPFVLCDKCLQNFEVRNYMLPHEGCLGGGKPFSHGVFPFGNGNFRTFDRIYGMWKFDPTRTGTERTSMR